jgi:hypothetical protein
MIRQTRRLYPVIMALTLAVTLIQCTSIFATALVRIKNKDELIRVIGSARKPIRSDLIIWRGRVTETAPGLGQAYAQLKISTDRIRRYLISKGVRSTEIFPLAIDGQTIFTRTRKEKNTVIVEESTGNLTEDALGRKVVSYRLIQEIAVRSQQVDLVARISRESTDLISQGMRFESGTPEYLYTKLGELKVVMQAEAAHDARARADQIALNSGCRVGEVRYARMSVPQITPLYSAQESDGGYDDTSSLDKKITAVVVAGFSIR